MATDRAVTQTWRGLNMNIPALAKQLKEIPPTVLTLNYKDKFLHGSVLFHGTQAQIQFDKIRWSSIGHSWTTVNEYKLIKRTNACLPRDKTRQTFAVIELTVQWRPRISKTAHL